MKRALPWLLFLGIFAVYAYTAYPTVAPRDSADLASAALTASAAHPPGYPLYALLGKAWISLIPWGDPAYRLNLLSAAGGAGCVAAVFLLLARSCGSLPALAAALALAFSAPLWKFSLLCEMYSWHGFFLAALLLLSPAGPAGAGKAALSALLLGLALVNHQAFILAVPGLLVLWWGKDRARLLRLGLPLFLLGLTPYLFLWFRLGDPGRAWAVLTRQEYGTWQLSAGFAKPWSLGLAASLLAHFFAELWRGTSLVAAALGLLGLWELWTRSRRQAMGLLLIFAAAGPGFFLASRFDVSGWVARTVLESALVLPAVVLCIFAGFGLAWVQRRRSSAVLPLAALLAGAMLWQQGPGASHRDDFSAYDYVKDLRRSLPPGGLAAVGGDTALYASRYFELAHPDGRPRRLVQPEDLRPGERPDHVLGLSLPALARLGLGPKDLFPRGLVQSVGAGGDPDSAWEFSALRRGGALRRQESYARDILLAYGFARYLSGVLREARRDPGAQRDYVTAAALDPEDYQIEYNRPP